MQTNYKCVTSVQAIRDYISSNRLVAFDFETAPDDPYREEDKAALDSAKAHIVGCSFSVKEGTGIYVPVAHRSGGNIDEAEFFTFLSEFLADREIVKIAHNIAFESAMAYAKGIVIQAPVYDTICAAQMTLKNAYEFRKLNESGLKRLAEELFGEPLPSFMNVTGGRHFDELDSGDAETVRYGAADADFALRLYYKFNDWFDRYLPKHRYIVEEIESPTAVYLGIMKKNGVPVNLSLMQQRKMEAEAEMERLRGEIAFIIGDVNIGANCSTQAFKNYLYQDLQLPVLKTTETNREAADDMTMTLLKEWCDKHRPEMSHLFLLVQEYRKWGKIKSTYIDGYMKYVNAVTGRIHPEIFALSTDTGRMNCRKPNAQNMPRKTNDPIGVRSFIQAPKGQLVLSLDFSQIELRVGAFYCRDEVMLKTYRENGDIHAATTSVIFGVSYEEAKDKHTEGYKERRTIAKNVNFGTFYGLFPRGLQKTLKFKAGIEKSVLECETIIANLKNYISEGHIRKRNKGELPMYLVEGIFEPLISRDDFDKAQEIRKLRAEGAANRNPILMPFSGMVKCGCCGGGFSRRTAGKYRRWGCNTRERKGSTACDSRPIKEEELVAAVRTVMEKDEFDAAELRRKVSKIVIHGDCVEFYLTNGRIKKTARIYNGQRGSNPFTNKVYCASCGSKCERDTWTKGTKMWSCSQPRTKCQLRRLSESELKEAAESLFGDGHEGKIVQNVERIVISDDEVVFHLKEGGAYRWQRQ